MSLHLLQANSNEYLTLNAGSQQERDQGTLTYPSEVSGKISQERGFKANEPQGMQQSDLFKAEYVFIVDSEGEDEATSRKSEQGPPGGMGTTATRPKSLAISSSLLSDVVRPKTRGTDLQAPSHPEMPLGMAPQQKHGQVGFPSCHKKKNCLRTPCARLSANAFLFKAYKTLNIKEIKKPKPQGHKSSICKYG